MTAIALLGPAVLALLRRAPGPVGHVVVFARPDEVAVVAGRLEELGHGDWSVRCDRDARPGHCYLVA